jgi:hypothetical protein
MRDRGSGNRVGSCGERYLAPRCGSLAEVAEWLDLLTRIGVVRFRAR